MLFEIQDALKTNVGNVVPLADEDYASSVLRRAVGTRAASRLIETVGASAALRLGARDLVAVAGVPLDVAELLTAARDYAHSVLTRKRVEVACASAVIAALPEGLAFADVEMLFAIALDGRHGVKAVVLIAKGGASSAAMTPRDLFLPLVRLGASAFAITHNHPSGSELPSDADVILTNTVARIGIRLGITLVDHIIVAAGGSFSFQEHNLLPTDSELSEMLHEDAGLGAGAP